eukprot:gene13706-biopygen557
MGNGPLWRPRAPRVPRGGVRRRGGWPECPAAQRGGAAGRPRSLRGGAWARLASGGASELATGVQSVGGGCVDVRGDSGCAKAVVVVCRRRRRRGPGVVEGIHRCVC